MIFRAERSGIWLLGVVAAVGCTAAAPVDDAQPWLGDCAARAEADAPSDPYADCVEEFDPSADASFNHDLLPDVAFGPPGGTLDTISIGCGGSITMFFDGEGIVDGDGPDFVVFENPFSEEFPEAGRISVSEDGAQWSTFECDALTLEGCAGRTPTEAVPESGIDPTDPAVAGGDAFDLADVGLANARYVRIEDDSDAYWSDLSLSYCDPGQGGKGGFDLDAIAVVHE